MWRRGAGGTSVRRGLRFAVVLVVGELRVLRGLLARCDLGRDGSCMALMHGRDFGRTWLHVDATVTTVVADAVGGLRAVVDIVHDDGPLIYGAYAGANVIDRAVVVKVMPLPIAAKVAEADVAKAVVDAAIEADVRAPISAMEAVMDATPAPVGRGPERAVVRRRNPFAGNPVIAVVAPAPVAGGPEIVGVGSGRLIVFRQRRRGLV